MSAKISERAGAAPYSHSMAGCLDGAIGKHGLSEAELAPWIEKLAPALAGLAGRLSREPAAAAARHRGRGGHRRGGGGAGQAERRRARGHLLRHGRVEPRRPDAGAARRLEHPGPRRRGAEAPAAHALLRQPRSRHAGVGARHVRSRHRALRRHLQVGRHAGDAGAGAGGHGGPAGGGPGGAHPRALPRHHRAARRRQGQRPARSVRGARHSGAGASYRHRRPLLGADQRRPDPGAGARPRRARGARRRAQRGGRR